MSWNITSQERFLKQFHEMKNEAIEKEKQELKEMKELHKMTERQARKEMGALGLSWIRTDDYLPQQHVLIFEKPGVD